LPRLGRSILPPSSTFKMEAVVYSETLVPTYQTRPYHITEDHNRNRFVLRISVRKSVVLKDERERERD
jgi:hypothetical protein